MAGEVEEAGVFGSACGGAFAGLSEAEKGGIANSGKWKLGRSFSMEKMLFATDLLFAAPLAVNCASENIRGFPHGLLRLSAAGL